MKKFLFLCLIGVLIVGFGVSIAAAEWPERPITIVCFASPGGGTDTSNRALAAALEPILGVSVKVINMTGGLGGTATNHVWNAPRDGYTWLGASESLLVLPVMGAFHTTTKDWEYFIFSGAPGPISVPSGSSYTTFEDLLKAVRENPNKVKFSCSGAGSIWRLKMEVVKKFGNFPYKFISYDGSAPSMVAAVSGEVDAVHTSISEQTSFIQAGKLKPLVMITKEPYNFPGVGKIPPITDYIPEVGKYLPLRQWLGIMLPSGLPQQILEKITDAYRQALTTERVKNYAQTTNSTIFGLYGPEAKKLAVVEESVTNWFLYDLGIGKKNPADFGIPKP